MLMPSPNRAPSQVAMGDRKLRVSNGLIGHFMAGELEERVLISAGRRIPSDIIRGPPGRGGGTTGEAATSIWRRQGLGNRIAPMPPQSRRVPRVARIIQQRLFSGSPHEPTAT